MNSRLVSLGAATPEHTLTQSQAAGLLISGAGLEGRNGEFAALMHRRAGVERRGSVLLRSTRADAEPADQAFFSGATPPPGTGERMRVYNREAPILAAAAARRCLAAARADLGDPRGITHLVTVSCTGFGAPGIDVALIDLLGLSPSVQRTHIGYMGCYGAIVGLRTADAIGRAEASRERRANVLLVCVELCSLHMIATDRPDQIVASALFADGAAAALFHGGTDVPSALPAGHGVVSSASFVFPGTREAMAWSIGDAGFEMSLADSVPDVLRGSIGPWMAAWLDSAGVSLERARQEFAWAVHPGGPRVLSAVEAALELPARALDASRAVLREHGNMSSGTVLFIAERLMREAETARPIVLLSFGPGLAAEALLLMPAPA